MEDILKECTPIIDEICEKFNYDTIDKEGNDSLRTVLLKAVPAMLDGRNEKDRQTFYQMLEHTPIHIISKKNCDEERKELKDKYFGGNIPQVKYAEVDTGEYGKTPDGAYVSEPVFDENLKLIGKKSFIYLKEPRNDKEKEFFGTNISVTHLIHELGHAWNAEFEQYTMGEDGVLHGRVGTSNFKHSVSKDEDGSIILKRESVRGLYMEEALNTILEENASAKYFGISLKEMKEKYNNPLLESGYQGIMSDIIRKLYETNSEQDLVDWRLYGDEKAKGNLEKWIEKTRFMAKCKKW